MRLQYKDRQREVLVRRNTRARRMTLRIDRTRHTVILTIPAKLPIKHAKDFIAREANWIADRMDELPGPVPFVDGAIVPVRGVDHVIRHQKRDRGVVRCLEGDGQAEIHVFGQEEHIARRVEDFLKKLAMADLHKAVDHHAEALGVKPTSIRVRDQKTRWGSCSSSGTLSFSWRLIMAPPFILDYLAAHETSHMLEMNHSSRFWALCRKQAPRTNEARAWLKEHGEQLHMMGQVE